MRADIVSLTVLVALITLSSFTAAALSSRKKTRKASRNRRASPSFQSVMWASSPLIFHQTIARRNEFHLFFSSRTSAKDEDDFHNNDNDMVEFFKKYKEWKPLFRNVMCSKRSDALASSLLLSNREDNDDDTDNTINLWGISTLEQRHPWRLLPSKPTLDSSMHSLSNFLDAWQQSLLDIPLDEMVTGENDLRFLEEGRRTIVVTRFHVLDEYNASNNNIINNSGCRSSNQGLEEREEGSGSSYYYDWEMELFRTCWSEMAHLMHQDSSDTGTLVLLPDWINNTIGEEGGIGGRVGINTINHEAAGLEYVQKYVEENLTRPIAWLGKAEDWEISAMKRGNLAVRLLYKLGDIPDLSKR